MFKRHYIFIISLCWSGLLLSCGNPPEPRHPVKHSSGSFISERIIEKNIQQNKEEESFIKEIIQEDSTRTYHASKSGFWYYYNTKDSSATEKPEVGDRVTFQYNLANIIGKEILSKETIGEQVYLIDQSNQDLIIGIRDGLKLMHVGETVTFLFPSYKAYGYYGLEDYVGPNTPLQCTITLNSIDKSKPKNNYEKN